MKWRSESAIVEACFVLILVWTVVAGVVTADRLHIRRRLAAVPRPRAISDAASYAVGPLRKGTDPRVAITVFTDFRCNACIALSLRLDTLMSLYPNIVVAERLYPSDAINSSEAAEGIECSVDFGAFPAMRYEFSGHQVDIEDGTWGAIAQRAGIADTAAFVRCIKERRHITAIQADSIAARKAGAATYPSLIVNDSLYQGPLELDELSSRVRARLRVAK